MSKKKLSYVYKLNFKDFFRFNLLINLKVMRVMLAYGLIIFFAILIFEWVKKGYDNINITNLLLVLVIILVTFTILLINMYKKSKKGWELNTAFHDEIKIEFDNKGFVCSTKNNTATVPWKKVMKVLESKYLIVVLISDTQAYMIPKNLDAIDKLKTIIKSNVNPKNCKLKK